MSEHPWANKPVEDPDDEGELPEEHLWASSDTSHADEPIYRNAGHGADGEPHEPPEWFTRGA